MKCKPNKVFVSLWLQHKRGNHCPRKGYSSGRRAWLRHVGQVFCSLNHERIHCVLCVCVCVWCVERMCVHVCVMCGESVCVCVMCGENVCTCDVWRECVMCGECVCDVWRGCVCVWRVCVWCMERMCVWRKGSMDKIVELFVGDHMPIWGITHEKHY